MNPLTDATNTTSATKKPADAFSRIDNRTAAKKKDLKPKTVSRRASRFPYCDVHFCIFTLLTILFGSVVTVIFFWNITTFIREQMQMPNNDDEDEDLM